jgi:hypothetical protein
MGYTQPARALNHAELVHRPGERELARRALTAMGCTVRDGTTGIWIFADEVFLLSEVTPEQWAFEEQFAAHLDRQREDPVQQAFLNRLSAEPQRYHHLGIGFASLADWQLAVERIEQLPSTDTDLAGRIEVASVFRPGDPGAYGDDFVQAFVRTDIFSVGLLALGQTIELQHYFENDPLKA